MTSCTYNSSTRTNGHHVCSSGTFKIWYSKHDSFSLKEYKPLWSLPQKSNHDGGKRKVCGAKFKIRFAKWKLLFYPCYHTFLSCLIVKVQDKTCFAVPLKWAITNPNFRLSADGLIPLPAIKQTFESLYGNLTSKNQLYFCKHYGIKNFGPSSDAELFISGTQIWTDSDYQKYACWFRRRTFYSSPNLI